MAFEGDAAVVLEAEEVIRKWLKGVEETTEYCNGQGLSCRPPHLFPPQAAKEQADYLGSLDWSEGSIADNARSVVQSLLRKDLPSARPPPTPYSLDHTPSQSHDPRVAMEMRQKKVKERRRLRDEQQRQCQESELLLKQAQREAEAVVRREERRAREKAAREEKLLQQQVVLVRQQLREQQRSSRRLAEEQRAAIERELEGERRGKVSTDGVFMTASPVILKAEEIIVSERKRQHTRSELIRQLEEAKVHETKENIKLLHRCFSAWYEGVVEQRAKLGKVVAVREWRLLVRVWGGWRRFVQQRRARRERDMATREMQRMRREHEVAGEHYASRLLLKVLTGWQSVVRLARTEKEQQQQQEVHRRKMEALLKVAASKTGQRVNSPDPSPHSERTRFQSHLGGKQPDKKLHPPVHKAPVTPEPAVWQVAKQQLTKLIKQVDMIATEATASEPQLEANQQEMGVEPSSETTPTSPEGEGGLQASANTESKLVPRSPPHAALLTQLKRPKPKPVTRPLPMAGMASRSAAISERRAAREKRREAMLEEKAKKLAREEEEKKRADQAAREALLQKKREERRLAKQREMEKLRRQQVEAELTSKAMSHYHTALLSRRGLAPWRRFVDQCRANAAAASQLRVRLLQRRAFGEWLRHWRALEAEKQVQAIALWDRILLKRSWQAWLKCVQRGRELEEVAVKMCPQLLVGRAFRGWCRVSKEERMQHWEKMAQARRFRQRYVQRQVLRAWSSYIPVAKEERAKESRRAELRRKVSSWLTDFQPQS